MPVVVYRLITDNGKLLVPSSSIHGRSLGKVTCPKCKREGSLYVRLRRHISVNRSVRFDKFLEVHHKKVRPLSCYIGMVDNLKGTEIFEKLEAQLSINSVRRGHHENQ